MFRHSNRKKKRDCRNKEECKSGERKRKSHGAQFIPSTLCCGHAFPQDCILPWFVEQRDNECSSFRSVFIDSDYGNTDNDNDFYSNSDSIAIEVDAEKGILPDYKD